MSVWRAMFGGWRFRSARPTFRSGDRLTAYVTGHEGGEGVVRVGDSVLTVPDVGPGEVDRLIDLRVVDFDAGTGRGRAERITAEPDAPG